MGESPLIPNITPAIGFQQPSSLQQKDYPGINPDDFFIESMAATPFDAFEEVEPSAHTLNEMEFNAKLGQIGEIVNEMDSASQWAVSGQLEHVFREIPHDSSFIRQLKWIHIWILIKRRL